MTINQQPLISNAYTLENFNFLETQGLDPKLAVSNSGYLVLYSQNHTGIAAKISQVVKDIFYKISFVFGFIKIDEKAIQDIKKSVNKFYFHKVKTEVEEEYNGEIIRLRSEHENLSKGIKSLKEETKEAQKKLEPFEMSLLEFHKVSEDLKEIQSTVNNLKLEETSLKIKIENHKKEIPLLESQCSALRNKKREVQAITTKYDNMELKPQVQEDYKKKALQAESKVNHLQNEVLQSKQKNSSSFDSGYLIGRGKLL